MNIMLSTKEQRILVINSINYIYPVSTDISYFFYKKLFLLCPETELAFKGTDAFRHRKFSSTLQSFHNIKVYYFKSNYRCTAYIRKTLAAIHPSTKLIIGNNHNKEIIQIRNEELSVVANSDIMFFL